MRHPSSHYLAAVGLLALAAFAVRAASLDAQSLWRDEVDALCYAFEFPHLIARTLAPEVSGSLDTPCACPPLPLAAAKPSDECVPRRLAQTLGGMLRHNGPLYFFLLRGWVALAGTSEYATRFFSLVFGVLCVPLVYALGCRLFNRPVGLLAALLVTTSPYLTWYGQEVKMYTLVPALALLAIYGLRRAVEGDAPNLPNGKSWHWWAVQVVAISLAFYSHILAALLIPIQMLLYFAWWPQARRQWVGALVSLACLTLPYLPLVIWQAPLILQERETGFHPYALDEMVEILLNGWSLGILNRDLGTALLHALARLELGILSWLRSWSGVQMDALVRWGLLTLGWNWRLVSMLMGTLAVWGLLSSLTPPAPSPARRGLGEGRGRLALVCWLVTPLLAVWLISLRQPLFTDRYLIWAAPAFYLLVASGLMSLRHFGDWSRWAVVLLVGIILISNGINLQKQATEPIKSDLRAAAAYVADHRTSGELILFQIPHGRYTFDYYFPEDEYPWAEGLYTNHRAPDGSYLVNEQGAAWDMQEMTAGYSAVWLIATETTMWDERGLVQAWLEANAQRTDEAHFMRVDVYQYLLPRRNE
ncbi:MAG: glycosyltransferase family 39 protein [Anaerolineae bacterium]